jgi:hypothetical protein
MTSTRLLRPNKIASETANVLWHSKDTPACSSLALRSSTKTKIQATDAAFLGEFKKSSTACKCVLVFAPRFRQHLAEHLKSTNKTSMGCGWTVSEPGICVLAAALLPFFLLSTRWKIGLLEYAEERVMGIKTTTESDLCRVPDFLAPRILARSAACSVLAGRQKQP